MNEVDNFWSKVFVRILHRRITDPTWQATFMIPEAMTHNRCFNIDYVARCMQSEDMAYDLFSTDFAHVRPDWQINLTGKTVSQWNVYDRERLGLQ